MSDRRALLLVNRGSTQAGSDMAPVAEVLASHGIDLTIESFDHPDAMSERIEAADDGIDRIVIGGGDGTMAAVAEALRTRGLPVGILPLGNACDLARGLGIPRDLVEAAQVIATGQLRKIDLGYVEGHPFFNMASLGLSVQVARRLTKETKRRWGVLSYPLMLWDAYHATRPFGVDVASNDTRKHLRTIQLGIGSGYHYGGGMTLSEDARLDDGLLHVYAIEPMSWPQLLLLLPRLWLGRYKSVEQVMVTTGTEFEVTTRSPREINADGEIVAETPATFKIAPGAISVFVPNSTEAPGLSP